MRSYSRRLAIAATLSVGLFCVGLSASAQPGPPVTADDMSEGSLRAPVTVIEYGSAACSHCAAWTKDVYPAFKAKYIDTGKVRYVFREALTAPQEVAAAGFMLARCAGKEKYFSVLDQVFHAQDEIFRTRDLRTPLLAVATRAGMTEQQFMACMTDQNALNALNARVQKWETTAKYTVTPTFDINGKRYEGGQSLAQLDAAIAEAEKR